MNCEQQVAHVSIIILNWNGWQDTIECLESIFNLNYTNYNIILIDNGSSNDSVQQISDWFSGNSTYSLQSKYEHLITPIIPKPYTIQTFDLSSGSKTELDDQGRVLFFKSDENLGFAVANNRGIEIAKTYFNSEYYFLLNNDTVVDSDALHFLVNTLENNKQIGAAQSAIYHYNQPNRVANAGGKILPWGQTKYFKGIRPDEIKKITFINGCALLLRSALIDSFGPLTERFFFGEEDFEFSMRMKQAGIHLACCAGSTVYHKIGVSSKELLEGVERSVFLFGLNRIVDMKYFYPTTVWNIWRIGTILYFFILCFVHYKSDLHKAWHVLYGLLKYTRKINDVRKSTVERIFKEFTL